MKQSAESVFMDTAEIIQQSILSLLIEAKLCREQGVENKARELEERARNKLREFIKSIPK